MAKPAIAYARFVIARAQGFISWQKLKEHIENAKGSIPRRRYETGPR